MKAILINGSLYTRRDAVARHYDYGFAMGPVEVSDNTEGHFKYVWEARAVGNSVWLRRANEDNTEWRLPHQRFVFEGEPVTELDVAFDQNGNIVLCAERPTGPGGSPEIWLYWFKPQEGDFVFEALGPGKSPRLILDDPYGLEESDVLLFYLNQTNQRAEFRVQRELYEDVHFIPTDKWYDLATGLNVLQDNTENMFLEEVALSRDRRIHVIASVWHPQPGRYQLLVAESAPYPLQLHDTGLPGYQVEAADLRIVVFEQTPLDVAEPTHTILRIGLVEPVLFVFPEDDSEPEWLLGSVRVEEPIIIREKRDWAEPMHEVQSINATTVVITAPLLIDYGVPTHSVQQVALEPA